MRSTGVRWRARKMRIVLRGANFGHGSPRGPQNELLELHLHPDVALEQIRHVYSLHFLLKRIHVFISHDRKARCLLFLSVNSTFEV